MLWALPHPHALLHTWCPGHTCPLRIEGVHSSTAEDGVQYSGRQNCG